MRNCAIPTELKWKTIGKWFQGKQFFLKKKTIKFIWKIIAC